jgi:AcrR family transcriptional regulator
MSRARTRGAAQDGAVAPAAGTSAQPSRKQLMAVAIDCFARLGYQGTSIDRIAREAGVTKGAVYYHFRDKEDLLFAAVTDRIGGFQKQVLDTVGMPAADAIGALRRVIDACFFHATVSNHRRFVITLMVEALDVNPRLSDQFREMMRQMRAYLAAIVRKGQARGDVRPDVEPEAVAANIAGGIMGAEIQHYQDPEQVDLRAALDTLVTQLAEWLAPRPSPDPAGQTPPRKSQEAKHAW